MSVWKTLSSINVNDHTKQKGDLAILELCHRELDRISEDLMEEERENHALEQQHQDDLIAYRSAVAL